MYNRYIPRNGSYTRVTVEDVPPPGPPPAGEPPSSGVGSGSTGGRTTVHPPFDLSALLFGGGEGGGISALLKTLKLDSLDSGDNLLLLIVLFLLVEGDDIELVIALGLVLIMGLNGEKENKGA